MNNYSTGKYCMSVTGKTTCGGIKPGVGITTLLLLKIISLTTIQI